MKKSKILLLIVISILLFLSIEFCYYAAVAKYFIMLTVLFSFNAILFSLGILNNPVNKDESEDAKNIEKK